MLRSCFLLNIFRHLLKRMCRFGSIQRHSSNIIPFWVRAFQTKNTYSWDQNVDVQPASSCFEFRFGNILAIFIRHVCSLIDVGGLRALMHSPINAAVIWNAKYYTNECIRIGIKVNIYTFFSFSITFTNTFCFPINVRTKISQFTFGSFTHLHRHL